jgi:hypothetical protein
MSDFIHKVYTPEELDDVIITLRAEGFVRAYFLEDLKSNQYVMNWYESDHRSFGGDPFWVVSYLLS